MSSHKAFHLSEEQILRALVDESDLSESMREHLSTCPSCRARRERLEEDLGRLGRMAERFAPSPEKRISLPEKYPANTARWFWSWRTAFGTVVMAALVIVIVWSSALFRTIPETGTIISSQEAWATDRLMVEISVLAENALPPVYLNITGESDPGFDEEFMQFVVPTVENLSQHYDSKIKGDTLCYEKYRV